jgi:hypothetical protein
MGTLVRRTRNPAVIHAQGLKLSHGYYDATQAKDHEHQRARSPRQEGQEFKDRTQLEQQLQGGQAFGGSHLGIFPATLSAQVSCPSQGWARGSSEQVVTQSSEPRDHTALLRTPSRPVALSTTRLCSQSLFSWRARNQSMLLHEGHFCPA